MSDITAFIGLGAMGEALLRGLLRAGRNAEDFIISMRTDERNAAVAAEHGVPTSEARGAVERARIIVLALGPGDVMPVVASLAPKLRPGQAVLSLAAGTSTAQIEALVPDGVSVVRSMSNIPALVGEGLHALSPGALCDEAAVRRVEALLAGTGRTVQIPEKLQDTATAISGSGPAYVFFMIEAMIDAGVLLGMPRAMATEMCIQTVYGSAEMIRETGSHPTFLREQVTSPAGTASAALRSLEDDRVKAAIISAIEQSYRRARELSSD